MRNRGTTLIPFLAALAFMLTACPNTGGNDPDGGTTDGGGQVACEPPALGEADCCTRSQDCRHLTAGGYVSYCDKSVGACELLCNIDSDCAGADFAPELCADGACVCDDGLCKIPACSADADCQGTGCCLGGSCEDCGALPAPTGCVIAPSPVNLHAGENQQLTIYATVNGEYATVSGTFTWASGDSSMVTVSAAGVATGGATTGGTTVTASLGSASCTADVNNYGAVTGSDVRVVVFDETSRLPIEGATVAIHAGGSDVGSATTLEDGSATLAGIGAATIDVHVFTPAAGFADAPNGYAYVSSLGLTSKDVAIYLPRNANPGRAGGYKGTMTKAEFDALGTDDVHVALAGASIPGNFMDMDLDILLGELIDTHVKYGTILDDVLPLPSGLVMGIGEDFFKDSYMPLSAPGLRTAWALGGNLPLSEVTTVLGPVLGGGEIEVGPLLGALLPLFAKFHSGIQPGVDVPDFPRLTDGSPDFDQFPTQKVAIDTPLALKGVVSVPKLPQVGWDDGAGNLTPAYQDGVIILGGVFVEGQGLVPLGITAALDVVDTATQTKNGTVNDTDTDPADDGKAVIRMAPQHGGVEGSPYVLLALAISFDDMNTGAGVATPQAVSGYARLVDRIQFDQALDFGATEFLSFAQEATVAAGSRTYTPSAVAGATFQRLSVDGPGDRSWVLYHGAGAGPVTLVDPSAYGVEDRFSATSNADAQAIVTDGAVTLDQLMGFTARNMDDMVRVIKGFSTVNLTVTN